MSDLFLLSERQMARVSPFFPRSHGVHWVDDRRVLSGIIHVIRNGLQMCDTQVCHTSPVTKILLLVLKWFQHVVVILTSHPVRNASSV